MCLSTSVPLNLNRSAFTLIEVLAALTILEFVALSVIVVINRCITSATDSELQMQAFEVARENMEAMLSKSTVQQGSDYGISDKYPGIGWHTVVETFFEPVTARMWLRGICSADYIDSKNQQQTIELTHWLTGLNTMELIQIMWQQEERYLADQLIQTAEQAAGYAGVNVKTIEQWLDNGMLKTQDGFFVKSNLDLYKKTGGSPGQQDKETQVQSRADLKTLKIEQTQQDWRKQIDPLTGRTYGELEGINIFEIQGMGESQGQ